MSSDRDPRCCAAYVFSSPDKVVEACRQSIASTTPSYLDRRPIFPLLCQLWGTE